MKEDCKILIVDDEKQTRERLKKVLERDGFCVEIAEHGVDAIIKMGGDEYDIILTDMRMPVMDGIDLLKRMKLRSPEVEIVIMTAYGDVNTYKSAMELGAFEYINKPFDNNQLRIVINRVVKKLAMKTIV